MSKSLTYQQVTGHCPRCGQASNWTIKQDCIPAWAASGIKLMPTHVERCFRCNYCGLKMPESEWKSYQAGVAELADAPDLGSGGETRVGSSPITRTNLGEIYD